MFAKTKLLDEIVTCYFVIIIKMVTTIALERGGKNGWRWDINNCILLFLQRNGEKKEAVGDGYIPDPKYPSRLGVRFSNRKFSTLLYKNIDKIIIFSAIIRSFNR